MKNMKYFQKLFLIAQKKCLGLNVWMQHSTRDTPQTTQTTLLATQETPKTTHILTGNTRHDKEHTGHYWKYLTLHRTQTTKIFTKRSQYTTLCSLFLPWLHISRAMVMVLPIHDVTQSVFNRTYMNNHACTGLSGCRAVWKSIWHLDSCYTNMSAILCNSVYQQYALFRIPRAMGMRPVGPCLQEVPLSNSVKSANIRLFELFIEDKVGWKNNVYWYILRHVVRSIKKMHY